LLSLLLLHAAWLGTRAAAQAPPEGTQARCGKGFLEVVNGQKVLHVSGTPYEMGYQHGALLKEDIREVTRYLLVEKSKDLQVDLGNLKVKPDPKLLIGSIAASQKKFVPEWYYEELRGLADGSGVAYQDLLVCNFIPELFHCSGFAITGTATKDGTLYHGRVLDYGTDWRLQEHPVLIIAKPEGKIPFVNVTYAGFIGSVTGMNAEHVAIGEMGGGGLGHWAGVPMAVLVRTVIQEAKTLEEAIAVFRDNPRTCEYYYVISDGKTNEAVGMEASWDKFSMVKLGESHEKLPHAVPDAVLLSAGDRYELLVERVKQGHGTFDAEKAIALMDRPVAMKSNLHNALFEPKGTRFWVAHASKDREPAATQPYHGFVLKELLERVADTTAPELPGPPAKTPVIGGGVGGASQRND
jgi:hypothetical protein